MFAYIILLVIGLLVGVFIGTMVESSSASKYVRKSQEELRAKDKLITTLTRQVLHLKDRRY